MKSIIANAGGWGPLIKKRRKTIAAASILLLILIVFHVQVVSPVNESIETNRLQAEQYGLLIEKLKKNIEEVKSGHDDLDQFMIEAREADINILDAKLDNTEIASRLESMLASISSAHFQKISFQPMQPRKLESFTEVNLRYNFSADVYGIYAFGERLKDFNRPLRIKDMRILVSGAQRKGGLPLNVTMTVATIGSLEN